MVQECKCFYPKSQKQFPIKMQHKDQKPGARCTNFSSKFEFPPKKWCAEHKSWVCTSCGCLVAALVLEHLQTCSNEYFRPRDDPHTQLFITGSLSQPKRNERLQGLTATELKEAKRNGRTQGLKATDIHGGPLGLLYRVFFLNWYPPKN